MTDPWIAFLGVVIASLISGAGVLYSTKRQAGKLDAEAHKLVTETAQGLVKTLRDELERKTAELERTTAIQQREIDELKLSVEAAEASRARLETHVRHLLGGVRVLTEQITQRGDTPRYTPPDIRL